MTRNGYTSGESSGEVEIFMTEVNGGIPSGVLKETSSPDESPPPSGVEPANKLTGVTSRLDGFTTIEAEADPPVVMLPITGKTSSVKVRDFFRRRKRGNLLTNVI